MAEAVIRRTLTAKTRVCVRVSPCGIFSGHSGTGTGFSPSSSVFTCQYRSTVPLCTHIMWGMDNRPVSDPSSETYSHPIDVNNIGPFIKLTSAAAGLVSTQFVL
jgi:hypothetical protein